MFGTTRLKLDRRTLLAGSLATATLVHFAPAGVFAQETTNGHTMGDKSARREKLRELGYLWRATSPSIHLGDTFTAVMTNHGQTDLTVYPYVMIMDHSKHYNLGVIDEEVTLPAGGAHTFTAVNDYGVANHFSTVMAASTDDPAVLGIDIAIVDSTGAQTASFNQLAFMIQSWEDLASTPPEPESEMDMDEDSGHQHGT